MNDRCYVRSKSESFFFYIPFHPYILLSYFPLNLDQKGNKYSNVPLVFTRMKCFHPLHEATINHNWFETFFLVTAILFLSLLMKFTTTTIYIHYKCTQIFKIYFHFQIDNFSAQNLKILYCILIISKSQYITGLNSTKYL